MSDTMKRMWTERQVRALGVDAVEQKSDLKVFENIVDKDGHKRFVEGDVALEEKEGVTKTYAKWSLSGSHLMIVLGLAIADTTAFANGSILARVTLPSWIHAKIEPVWTTAIMVNAGTSYASDWSTQAFSAYLSKGTSQLQIVKNGAVTMTANRNVRLQFDILIDNA